jgi:hypothetical protein
MRSLMRAFAAATLVLGTATVASADKIVLTNDEWTTTNVGFANAPAGAATFVLNVADFFTGGGAGNFLVVSENFSLDLDQATSFAGALTGAGHTLVDSEDVAGFSFDLPTLQSYDGVFFALPPEIDQNVLISYVNAGGNVYISGGGSGLEHVSQCIWPAVRVNLQRDSRQCAHRVRTPGVVRRRRALSEQRQLDLAGGWQSERADPRVAAGPRPVRRLRRD